jgi:hypothetical protein
MLLRSKSHQNSQFSILNSQFQKASAVGQRPDRLHDYPQKPAPASAGGFPLFLKGPAVYGVIQLLF